MTLGVVASEEQIRRRDRNRYYVLLEDELERLEFSEPEACAIVDALNGTAMDADSYRSLWMSVVDACRADGVGEKWGVDGAELESRLRELTPGQAMAVVDAAERFWGRVSETGLSTPDLLVEVGLL